MWMAEYGSYDQKPNTILIEDKGSGISLRQELQAEGIPVVPFNPGRADKLQRLHAVSHLFAHGHVWVVESEKNPGQPRTWADPLISQLCSFHGEGSIKHDDYVDSTTQALRLLADRNRLSVTTPFKEDVPKRKVDRVNPYGA
jgi:predicted phage terminase large subunit-like protein